MSHPLKKALCFLAAAVLTAAAAGLFCLFTAKPSENGRAVILFTETASRNEVVDTEISRKVSAFRRAVTEDAFLKMAAVGTDLTAEDIKKSLSVSRLGGTSGAEIILCGLDKPSEAPIILMNILCIAEDSAETAPFKVISGCDLSHAPRPPYYSIIAGAGLAGGLVCFLAMTVRTGGKRRFYCPERADTENDYQSALFMEKYIEDVCKTALNLGELPLTAPEGLEKSGYTEAAKRLAAAARKKSAKIIAVASDGHRSNGEIPPAAKITSYLACAMAEAGIRTVIIDCMINDPAVAKIFKISPSCGLSDFVKGECAVWDILSVNARKGVDVIPQKKGAASPSEVFSSPEYERLLEYLSPQYDFILLCAPRAWNCNEWGLVTHSCKGFVIVPGEGSVSANTAKEILGQKSGFAALCSVKKPDTPESEENPPDKK